MRKYRVYLEADISYESMELDVPEAIIAKGDEAVGDYLEKQVSLMSPDEIMDRSGIVPDFIVDDFHEVKD